MTHPIKLFCIPHAGGLSSIYSEWSNSVGPEIELIPVELAGRGSRFSENPYKTINQAIDDITELILRKCDNKCYAIYGHSMGAYISYEVILKLMKITDNLPQHLFVSGKGAPYLTKETFISGLPDKQVIQWLNKLGGIPKELIENYELMKLFLPVIRNDYKLIESYNHNIKKKLSNVTLTVLTGKFDESITIGEVEGWKEYSEKEVDVYQISGGHFFINESVTEVISIIKDKLLV
ncbi:MULTISPECIES: thioesterase II family protein [Bacillus amyloliquefaciens group]|uniref:thioesterase II family protein n=1 Tax=Bacillus amyloliquefaciens group TaxID=1938374 RepID=UPI0015811FAD|nr:MULTISPECIES: thioesterase [Bacillus amyloliquefaciens group]NUI24484.1 thioesterase [Bacillus amyloliquefaciens]NUI33506.1 thioesterase [Bacillus amyloliquefaciens]NUI37212.1 thioesterase [Bacillus amyloliquefaciens]NUI71060.1 thioesterase [Bacillus amyloliquefaciens]NUI73934.1 thioesterase [Bacillus amyloliquefaciens]